jgi:hypothetical protein
MLRAAKLGLIFCIVLTSQLHLSAAFGAPLPLAALSVAERQKTYSHKAWQHTTHMAWQASVTSDAIYSDNVRGSRFQRQSDIAYHVTPSVRFKTQSADHGVSGTVAINRVQFMRYATQNQWNGGFKIAPYYRLPDNWTFNGLASLQLAHELPTAETAQPLVNAPTPYRQTHVSGHLTHAPGHGLIDLFAQGDVISFDNAILIGGAPLINNDRDRIDTAIGLGVGVQNSARNAHIGWYNTAISQNFKRLDFDPLTGLYDGLNRDNHGWRSQITFKFEPTHLLQLQGETGIERRMFQSGVNDRSAWIGHLHGAYLLTPLTNIIFDVERSLWTTAYDASPAMLLQRFTGGLKHELTRDIVLNLSAYTGQADYWNTNRRDRLTGSNIGITYRQNRTISWQVQYDYRHRDSSIAVADYHENRLTFGARIEF